MKVQAIKTVKDISLIKSFLLKKQPKLHYLFTFGMNVALRIGDLLSLKYTDIVDNEFNIKEGKTGKYRLVTLNEGAQQAVISLRALSPHDIYLFQSTGNRAKGLTKAFSSQYVLRAFKEAQEINGLSYPYNLGTHSMRQTFGYHQYKYNNMSLGQLQTIFGHSSEGITLAYIGITAEDTAKAYHSLVL